MRVRAVVDGLVAACLALMVAAPLAVSLATPEAPPAVDTAPLPAPAGPVPELTPVPVFGSEAGREAARRLVAQPDRLEPELAAAVQAVTGAAPELPLAFPMTRGPQVQLPELRLAAGREAAALDLAGLLMVADAHGLAYEGSAAAAGLLAQLPPSSCPGVLGRLLVATAGYGDESTVRDLVGSAASACPGDVTPAVLQAVWAQDNLPADEAAALLQELASRAPALALSLEGDLLLREALEPYDVQPFSARAAATQALRRYDAVARVLPDAELGAAEALRLLGRQEEAVLRLTGLVERVPSSRLAVERLAEAQELAGRPDRAADLLARSPEGDASRLFPGGTESADTGAPLPIGSLSVGLVDAVPAELQRPADPPPATGVTVQDFSFVPAWRPVPGVVGALRGCPTALRARAELAAGRVERAAAAHRDATCSPRPARFARLLVELQGGDRAAAERAAQEEEALAASGFDRPPLPDPLDDLHELQRYVGDRDAAQATVRRWQERAPRDPLPVLRRAELAFLSQRWREAATLARESAELGTTPAERAAALLVAGAADGAAGRDAAALSALDRADELLVEVVEADVEQVPVDGAGFVEVDYAAQETAAYLLFEVRLSRGNLRLRAEEHDAAEADFSAASQAFAATGSTEVAGAQPALAEVGQALAALGDGRPKEGLEAARAAVRADPDNPLFLLDLAFVQRRAGNLDAAERNLRRARRADPRLGVAALDLGTMLAEQERDEEAEAVLREAVALESTSAPGWHTLGVVLSRGSARDVLQAQAAFARAAREDKDFRGRERVPVYDDRIYVSRLDLSKPLPPEWSFSTTEQRLPATALAAAVVLGMIGWLRGKYIGKAVGIVEGHARSALERTRRVPAYLAPAVAVVGTFFVLLSPVVRADLPVAETLVLTGGVGLLLLALVRARRRYARGGVRHVAWTPALVVGVAGAATGLGGYAPVPAAQGTAGDPRVHRAGPLLLFGTGMALLGVATLTEVPVARVLATSALGMAAVCLTPAGPFDGRHVAAPRTMRVMAVLGTAVAIGLAVGIL